MPIPHFLEQIARERGCSPELARSVITDCLAALHEASYKGGTAAGVLSAHAELGPLAAWHLMGLVVDAADTGNPGALVEAYMRIEPDPARFDAIFRDWDDGAGDR
jgi:hypothetical protein